MGPRRFELLALLHVLLPHPESSARIGGPVSGGGFEGSAGADFAALPSDVALHVLRLVPSAPRAAWIKGDNALVLLQVGAGPRELHHEGAVKDAMFFPRADRLLSRSAKGTIVIWDVRFGTALRTLSHDGSGVLDVQVFPDGVRLVTLGWDRSAVIWSADTGKALQRINVSSVPRHSVVRVLLAGEVVATGVQGPVAIWDVAGQLRCRGADIVRLFEASPCGTRYVTSGWDDMVSVWSARTARLESSFRTPVGWPHRLWISHGGATVAAAIKRSVFVWSGSTGALRRSFVAAGEWMSAALSPAGDRVFVLTDAAAGIYNADSGERLLSLDGFEQPGRYLSCVVFSPTAKLVAASGRRLRDSESAGTTVEWNAIWDASTGRMLYASEERRGAVHTFPVSSIALGAPLSMAEELALHRTAALPPLGRGV